MHEAEDNGSDVAIDVLDKLVQAEATGAVFDHVVGRRYSLSRT